MFILLNGPLGIGKSTLAEALTESLDCCVMLDGDDLVAVNPPAANEVDHLHATIALLVEHHRRFGYHHFVIDHLWRSAKELEDLRRRLAAVDPEAGFHCFLLTLPAEENQRRIERRQQARALDEREFEVRTSADERQLLSGRTDLGEPFDVSASPDELAATLLRRLASVAASASSHHEEPAAGTHPPKLFFLCGKMAAGKSTLACQLADREHAVVLAEDEFLDRLYPDEIADISDYIRCSSRLRTSLSAHIARLLGAGTSVILDFPGNTRRQREWFRQLIAATHADHELHFIDVPDEVCKRQLRKRSQGLPSGAAWTTDDEFDAVTSYFEPPSEDEQFNVIRHVRS